MEKLTTSMHIRLSDSERKKLVSASKQMNVDVSTYVRALINNSVLDSLFVNFVCKQVSAAYLSKNHEDAKRILKELLERLYDIQKS